MKYCFGVDIGGTTVKMGLFEESGTILDKWEITTDTSEEGKAILPNIATSIEKKIEEHKLDKNDIAGIGAGVPAPVTAEGVVNGSANLGWTYKEVKKELEELTGLTSYIANDANVAALGEMWKGGGEGEKNMIMVTLGTGVGGGIILDGEIYEGRGMGGSELGHMVIVENGEPCTCGRRGCLEAYVSITALKREAYRAAGKEMDQEEIFALAEQGDPEMKKVVDTYIRRLGLGIVNIVNIFRPQLVLLGGDIPKQGEALLSPLRRIVEEECFGRDKGDVPEIEEAILGREAGMIGAAGLV